jgi:hypothetical protein
MAHADDDQQPVMIPPAAASLCLEVDNTYGNATAIAAARCNAYTGCHSFGSDRDYAPSPRRCPPASGTAPLKNGVCFKYFISSAGKYLACFITSCECVGDCYSTPRLDMKPAYIDGKAACLLSVHSLAVTYKHYFSLSTTQYAKAIELRAHGPCLPKTKLISTDCLRCVAVIGTFYIMRILSCMSYFE